VILHFRTFVKPEIINSHVTIKCPIVTSISLLNLPYSNRHTNSINMDPEMKTSFSSSICTTLPQQWALPPESKKWGNKMHPTIFCPQNGHKLLNLKMGKSRA
jgi:hypothetical protein